MGWPLRLLSLTALILVLVTLVALLPQFTVETVTVTGSRLLEASRISQVLEDKVGQHFVHGLGGSFRQWLTLRYGKAEAEILALSPLIRQVEVAFSFPSSIHVQIQERVEILAIRVSGGYALVDRDNMVLRLTDQRDFSLPVLEGCSLLSQAREGQVLDLEKPSQLLAAARITAALIRHDQTLPQGRQLMEEVKQYRQLTDRLFYLFIPLEQGGDIRVKLEDNRLLQDKLLLLSYLLDKEDILQGSAGELDLSGETAFFRPDGH